MISKNIRAAAGLALASIGAGAAGPLAAQDMIAVKPAEAPLETGSPQTEPLVPSQPWVVDYGEDRCTMLRRFGPEDSPVYLRLRQITPGDSVEYMVMGRDLKARTKEPIKAYFFPGNPVREIQNGYKVDYPEGEGLLFESVINLSGKIGDGTEISASEVASLRDAKERAVEYFELRSGVREPLTLATGPVHEPLAALRSCVDDLMESYGVDTVALEAAKSRAQTGDVRRWARAILREAPGGRWNATISMALIVDERGRVERCLAKLPVASDSLETFACEQMQKHARFDPAIDAEGNPIKDYSSFTFTFTDG